MLCHDLTRSPPAHRRQRAVRATVRKQLRRKSLKRKPAEWVRQYLRIASHHSLPFHQLGKVFCVPSKSGYMPQKWECGGCGAHVPLACSFCGQCGQRWDKQSKKQSAAKNKSKQDSKMPPSTAFVMPAVGVQISQSNSVGSVGTVGTVGTAAAVGTVGAVGLNAVQTAQAEKPSRSIKSQLHHRANRIGKVEARIDRLVRALEEVKTTWPQYVHRMHQEMAEQHAKCTKFHVAVTKELESLRVELHGLLTQQLHHMPQVPMQTAMPGAQQALQQAQQALAALAAVSGMNQPTYAEVPQMPMPMEEDTHIAAQGNGFQIPHVGMQLPGTDPVHSTINMHAMMHQTSMASGYQVPNQVPCLPVQQPAEPQIQEADIPQGNWTWPPAMPNMPNMNVPGLTSEPVDMMSRPAEADYTHVNAAPVGHVQNSTPTVPLHPPSNAAINQLLQGADVSPDFLQTLTEAAHGLNQLSVEQGGGGGQGLSAKHLEQLTKFAQQQQQCHQDLMSFHGQVNQMNRPSMQQQATTAQTAPATPVVLPAPPQDPITPEASSAQEVGSAQSLRGARIMQTPPARAMSINSSPGQPTPAPQMRTETYSISPRGQRQQKVSKSQPGPVHSQPSLAYQLPVYESDGSSLDPTPVPTEVATDEEVEPGPFPELD